MTQSVYIRCLAVVDSCITKEQCDVALNYIVLAQKAKLLDWDSFWLVEKRLEVLERDL